MCRSASQIRSPSASKVSSATRRCVGLTAFRSGRAMVLSAMLPGVRAMAMIRPQASARQWTFVVRPPHETLTAWANSPFSGRDIYLDDLTDFLNSVRWRAVRFHMRIVETEFIRNGSYRYDLGENPLPDPMPIPPSIAVADRLGRPLPGRYVPEAAASRRPAAFRVGSSTAATPSPPSLVRHLKQIAHHRLRMKDPMPDGDSRF